MTHTTEQRAELRRKLFDNLWLIERPLDEQRRCLVREIRQDVLALLDADDDRDVLAARVMELEKALRAAFSNVAVAYMHRREPDLAGKRMLHARSLMIDVLAASEQTPRTPAQDTALDDLSRLGQEMECPDAQ